MSCSGSGATLPQQSAMENQKRGSERGMARLSRLCDIISNSLETNACVPTGVSEKQILLSLSSVYKEVQKLCQLQDLEDGASVIAHNCAVRADKGLGGKCTCLANIVFTMVSFFEHDSQFVQHLTANILFTISTSLIEADNLWVKFLLLIWIALATTMSSICECALPCGLFQNTILTEITRQEVSIMGIANSEIVSFEVLQSTRADLTYRTVCCLFQVLHQMMKYLKNQGDELEYNFIVLSVKVLQNLPWDCYGKFDFGSSKLKSVLSGHILQFACSLVQTNKLEDPQNSSMEVSNLCLELVDLVPKFLCCFFGLSDGIDKCLLQYARHKTLMLMIRLSCHVPKMDTTRFILWLRSLKQYFPDLIYTSFSNNNVTPDSCLEESPFFSCSGELASRNPQTRHLQRQALLLFFKCCLRLIQASDGIEKEQCSCGKENSLNDCSTNCCSCCSNFGLSEITEWLKCAFVYRQAMDALKSSMDFGLSLIQLFINEDDMLFCMLLEFLDASTAAFQIESRLSCYPELHLLSSITNPVCLFHILLFLIKYDHMVLVDYLRSKDTGVLCAQYVLRSLRFLLQSWKSFAEFSTSQLYVTDRSNKRRKLSEEDCDDTSSKAFEDAKECLVSLKNTLEDLHSKNLFPYNPKALLKSLSRFQGLLR